MWQCPHCGEQIDDVFDACWKCGTARDGAPAPDLQPESSAPEPPGWEEDAEPGDEPPEASTPVVNRRDDRLVELCSAGNGPEAHALRALLASEGIEARVVGDVLNALPLGQPVAPRLWVWANDLDRARAILEEQEDQPWEPFGAADEEDEEDERSAPAADHVMPSGGQSGFLSNACVILGAACIVLGAVWAVPNWVEFHRYRASAQGVLVRYLPRYSTYDPPQQPPPLPNANPTIGVRYDLYYAFRANGKVYEAVAYSDHLDDRTVEVHYNPDHPEENTTGPVAHPWNVLAVAIAIGMPLALLGYYFRKVKRAPSMAFS